MIKCARAPFINSFETYLAVKEVQSDIVAIIWADNVQELKELTEYKHRPKQRQRLAHMGIPFKVGRFGRPIVLRDAAVESLGGKIRMGRGTFDVGPDLEALAAVQNGS